MRKTMRKIKRSWKLIAIIITIVCAFMAAVGQALFKLGSLNITPNLLTWVNWQIILGLAFYGIAVIMFAFVVKKVNLSFLYPVIATSYIWVALFSFFILKETLYLSNWIGIMLILLGVSLATIK